MQINITYDFRKLDVILTRRTGYKIYVTIFTNQKNKFDIRESFDFDQFLMQNSGSINL